LLPIAFNNKDLHSQILIMNNAFRNMVYGAGFVTNPFQPIIEPFASEPAGISKYINEFNKDEKVLIIGNAFNLYKELFTEQDLSCFIINENSQPSVCAEAIFNFYLQDKSPALKKWNEIIPLYIRGSEAEEKLKLKLSSNTRNN